MRKKILKIFIIITLSLICVGCWDARDIDKMNIVSMVLIDKDENGIVIYVEIAPMSEKKDSSSGGEKEKGIMLKGEGETIVKARKSIDLVTNKPIFLGATQCTVITKGIGEVGIQEYLLRIRQMPEFRKTMNLIFTEEKPDDLFKADTENDKLVGMAIDSTITNLVDSDRIFNLPLAEALEIIESKNKNYLMPIVELKDKKIALKGYAVFKSEKHVGIIPFEDSEGLVLLKAKQPEIPFAVMYNDILFSIETELVKRKITVNKNNDTLSFSIKMDIDARLVYLQKDISVTKEVLKDVSNNLEKIVEDMIKKVVNTSQNEFKSDYLGFYTALRLKYPDLAKDINWMEEYPKAQVSYQVTVDLSPSDNIDFNPHQNRSN